MKAISDGLRRELEAIATARGIDLRIADAVSHGCAVPATARYSTLQDLDAGRHTEINMFSGALMRMGKEDVYKRQSAACGAIATAGLPSARSTAALW